MTKLLRIEAPHFVAAAIWHKPDGGDWRVLRCAPILDWMRGKSACYVGEYLNRKAERGWTWQWC